MLSFIVAMDQNNVIGYQNEMPWHLPKDLRFFKEKTTSHTIVMGRKTFESIGKVLPNRKHIVLTSKNDGFPDEVEIVHDIKTIVERFKDKQEEVFVIGGGGIFKQLMDDVSRLYVTKIAHTFEGDVFFPEIHEEEWQITSREKGIKDDRNPYDYEFIQYDRK